MVIEKQHGFKIMAEKLSMLNPLAVLARGYGIVRTNDGQLVNNVTTLQPGKRIEIVLNEGLIDAEIIRVQEGHYGKS